MNKIHSFAKVLLAAIGIFFAIRLLPSIFTPISLAAMMPSELPILTALFWSAVASLCLVVLLYVFVYKREQLAKKIVRANEAPEPDSQIQWLPVAFRLLCITAGLYCLHTVAWRIMYNLTRYAMYKGQAAQYARQFLNIEQTVSWLVMLAIGIYLVCGAPHFVRWHVKETLEQCKQKPEINK